MNKENIVMFVQNVLLKTAIENDKLSMQDKLQLLNSSSELVKAINSLSEVPIVKECKK